VKHVSRRVAALASAAALVAAAAPPTQAQTAADKAKSAIALFKIVTVKDEIVVGLNERELAQIGGQDAGAVARALAGRGELTVWQYGVRRGPNNEPQQAPTQRIGLLAHASLRVEPYKSPYPVIPHD
jgi:hypothetical protein